MLRAPSTWLPFRYQIGFPVELMTAALHRARRRCGCCSRQWVWVGALAARLLVRCGGSGLQRFAAYGADDGARAT